MSQGEPLKREDTIKEVSEESIDIIIDKLKSAETIKQKYLGIPLDAPQ